MNEQSRAEQALVFICCYAQTNSGITPSSEELADELGVSQQRAYYLLNRLSVLKKIEWKTRYKYKVINSTWEPPPEVEV